MPYITKERRHALKTCDAITPGELNYLLTVTVRGYLKRKGLSYQTLNDIVGALEGCKAEFQRRVVAPYEDTKIKVNGDCY